LCELAQRAGIDPVPKDHLHALVFLANCLSPLFDERGIETRVVKHQFGPFYPDAQWDVDRMVAQGLVAASNVHYVREDIVWWMRADYRVTPRGSAIYARSQELPLFQRTSHFMIELVGAFASIRAEYISPAIEHDAIYSTPAAPLWAPLVFDKAQQNFSAMTADSFQTLLPAGTTLSARERVELYIEYLKASAVNQRGVE
jgi:hypothetical protein